MSSCHLTGRHPAGFFKELSNEKKPGWLGYIGDEKLPSYIGINYNKPL